MSRATVKIGMYGNLLAMLNIKLLALSIQISNVTTYPGDKGEEQPAPEPQHTQEPLNGCLLRGGISSRGEMAL